MLFSRNKQILISRETFSQQKTCEICSHFMIVGGLITFSTLAEKEILWLIHFNGVNKGLELQDFDLRYFPYHGYLPLWLWKLFTRSKSFWTSRSTLYHFARRMSRKSTIKL